MAKRTVVTTTYEDDLTGAPFDADTIRTVRFSLDGTLYEIDLGPDSIAKFDKAMAPYIQAARRIGGAKKRASGKQGTSAAQVRQWAADNGIDVPMRGRIPEAVRQQFEAANAANAA